MALTVHEQLEAAEAALTGLEQQAGLSHFAERARDVSQYNFRLGSPLGSKFADREQKNNDTLARQCSLRRMRAVYFAVEDMRDRLILIAAARQVDQLRQRAAEETVKAAHVSLHDAVQSLPSLRISIFGSIGASFSTWCVAHYAGLEWALAWLAPSLSMVATSVVVMLRDRDSRIRTAERDLQAAEDMAEGTLNMPKSFSQGESLSGEDRKSVV